MNERQLVYKNGSLLLVGITRDDAGSYRCSVASNKQLSASGDVVVTVMGKNYVTVSFDNLSNFDLI